jgi:hypothetical protein
MSNRWSSALVAALVAAGTFGALPTAAEACSCAQPSVSQSWHDSTDMFKGHVKSHRIQGNEHQYAVEIMRTFSGCTRAGDVVTVETSISTASCGMPLQVGEDYVLAGYKDPTRTRAYDIGLCGYNRVWSTVTGEDLEFLRSRPVVCEDDATLACADGSEPVQCFVDSCQVDVACADAEVCEFNTCGGCDAEFYDGWWNPVCE